MFLELTQENFSTEIEEFSGVVMVDFWAPWCGPCRQQSPIVDELAQDLANNDQIKIAKINIDENQDISQRFNIRSIPTLVFFKAGKIDGQLAGLNSKDILEKKINELLEN